MEPAENLIHNQQAAIGDDMGTSRRTIGRLNCTEINGNNTEESPEAAVILCHGYGAPGDDLVDIGHHVLGMDDRIADRVRFVFPEAPISLEEAGIPGGRAWWPLRVAELIELAESGDFERVVKSVPGGMDESRDLVLEVVQQVCDETSLPLSKILIGGFSQGAMQMADVAFHLDESPAILIQMSGILIALDRWKELAPNRKGMKVLQSHGQMDPILPFVAAEWLREFLLESGIEVEFIPFMGPHAIPGPVLFRLKERIVEVLDEEDPG